MKKYLFVFLVVLLSSCHTKEKIVYLQDNLIGIEIETVEGGVIRFKPNDIISIFVSSKDPALATVFNLPRVQQTLGGTTTSIGNNSYNNGILNYTVDAEGCIDFPVLGEIKVEGMSKKELSNHIKSLIIESEMIKDPVVTINFENLTFSTIGEVAKPNSYSIKKDQITIFEALSMANDLTIYGVRDRVFLSRQEGNKLTTYQLDLRSKEIYNSPAFYIQQNDIIYVEPNRMRANQSTLNGNSVLSTSFWISLASLATTVLILIIN